MYESYYPTNHILTNQQWLPKADTIMPTQYVHTIHEMCMYTNLQNNIKLTLP